MLELMSQVGATDFVVVNGKGNYLGMVVGEDIKLALMDREAIPLLLTEELMRADIPLVKTTDDLAATMDAFSRHDVGRLPVCVPQSPQKVIGLISRAALMRRYTQGLSEI